MPKALLLLIIVPLYTVQNLFCKLYSKRYEGDPVSASWIYLIFCGAINAVAGWVILEFLQLNKAFYKEKRETKCYT